MTAEARRRQIQNILQTSNTPISATALAGEFSVSRQVIVGDVAILRASGVEISATPRGYMILRENTGIIRQIVCHHSDEQMEKELHAIVDHGCTVLDVIVEHPVYGQLTGSLQLSNRYDVQQFLERCAQSSAHPLSHLTEGIHLHTLSCPSEDAFHRVTKILTETNILLH